MKFFDRLSLSAETAMVKAATTAWGALPRLHSLIPSSGVQPKWAPAPLVPRAKRSSPELGWPRTTDSLCPECVREVRQKILDGDMDVEALIHDHRAEIKAQILERDGKIIMTKKCDKHGEFDDILSTDPTFLRRIENFFPGRDYEVQSPHRNHGVSTIKYGRGAVLTVDLTDRCNMVCDQCFMDANHAGLSHVHELSWDDIVKILDESAAMPPKRQMSIQFSGGEPTLHPLFLDAVRYARKLGYFAVQCATNGIRFAQEPEFARQAKDAGLRIAYLQFDGVRNENQEGRHITNLFDVKRQAIDNLGAVGIEVVLVATITRGENHQRVGEIVQFAIENADKVTTVSFQPVAFTGRLEDIPPEERKQKRYTLSHMAYDLRDQLGFIEPMRDFFPLSAMNAFGDLTDRLLADTADWGAPNCGCHPHCGIGTILFVNKRTKQFVPLTKFINLSQLLVDLPKITDSNAPTWLTLTELALALAKNWRPEHAPPGYTFVDLIKQFRSQTGWRGQQMGEFEDDSKNFEWRPLFIAGMHFQDLFVYDFRRTEMCVIPYGTQEGQISFCAYNTGMGWRAIVEKMHQVPLRQYQDEHGRHKIFGKGKSVPLPGEVRPISIRRDRHRLRVLA